jgi:hypothetical protein
MARCSSASTAATSAAATRIGSKSSPARAWSRSVAMAAYRIRPDAVSLSSNGGRPTACAARRYASSAGNAAHDIECLVDDVAAELEDDFTSASLRKLAAALGEFATYIANNARHIVNYGERFRAGEWISTGFVESAINQIVDKRFDKRQSMRWTPRGAHLLLGPEHASSTTTSLKSSVAATPPSGDHRPPTLPPFCDRPPSSTVSRRSSVVWSHRWSSWEGLAAGAAQQGSGQRDCELSSDCRDRVFDMSFGSDRRRLGVWDGWICEMFGAAGGLRGESPLVRG